MPVILHGIKDIIYPIVKAYFIRSTFLDRTFFDLLSRASSVREIVDRLKTTRYAGYLEGVVDAKGLEMSLFRSLIDMHFYLLSLYPDERVLRALFSRYISWDVKTVLKGKALGMEYEKILGHVYLRAEELLGRRDLIVRAASTKTLADAVEELSNTEYGEVATRGLRLYGETGDPAVFDLVIDRYTVGLIVESVSPGKGRDVKKMVPGGGFDDYTNELVLSFIDEYNLGLSLRFSDLRLTRLQAQSLLIGGSPYLNVGKLGKLIKEGASTAEYRALLERTPYSTSIMGEGKDPLLKSILLRRLVLASSTWRKTPLSHPVLVATVLLTENEVRNLSAVTFGVENRLPREEIEHRLIII